jgi:hypothetical protein
MNAHERHRFTAEISEQLLEGHAVGAHHAPRLTDLLAMVSTAAFPGELSGEDAAVAAFREAMSGDLATQSGRGSRTKSVVVAKLLTLKAAAIAVAAVSAGGVALAATTGVLPSPLAPENPSHSTNAPAQTNDPATPSPSLAGLCTAYLAGAGADHGEALESPAFSALITAAGGKDNVDAYCVGLGATVPGSGTDSESRGDHATRPPATHPGPTDHPTGPTEHPTGEPSHPTGAPTSHPSG